MDFAVSRDVLLPVLNKVIGAIERKTTMPIFSHALIKASGERLEISGTDLEVSITASCEAVAHTEGEAALPARKLYDICRNLSEGASIRVRLNGERCTVTAGRGRFTLGTLPAGDFPMLAFDAPVMSCQIADTELKRMLGKVAPSMAQNDVRYYLNGVLFEWKAGQWIAVATDGHRLGRFCMAYDADLSDDEPKQVIIPTKTVLELRRLLNEDSEMVMLHVGDRSVRVEIGDLILTSKLIDGRYPDYERVIPTQTPLRAVVDQDALKRALTRTAVLSNEKYKGVRCVFDGQTLALSARNPEQEEAEEEVEIEYGGEHREIGFNVAYLTDALASMSGEQAEILFSDAYGASVSSLQSGCGLIDGVRPVFCFSPSLLGYGAAVVATPTPIWCGGPSILAGSSCARLSKVLPSPESIAAIRYSLTVTGNNGDITLPISSWQMRRRYDGDVWLSCVVPGASATMIATVLARINGNIILRHHTHMLTGAVYVDTVLDGALTNFQYDRGTKSASITLTSSITRHNTDPQTRPIYGDTYRAKANGVRRARLGRVDPEIQPGDTVIFGDGETWVVGSLVTWTGVNGANMELTELEVL